MTVLLTSLMLAGGLVLLVAGAEFLVRGASGLAGRFGIPSLIVGLTVVAFGTSAPEMAVSVTGALQGRSDLAYGNVVGSNIFNVLFILGASAAITPLAVARQILRVDVPIMIGLTGIVFALAQNGRIGRLEGLAFVAALAAYTLLQVRLARRGEAEAEEVPSGPRRLWVQLVFVAGGLAVLVVGSRLLVDGAVSIARAVGASELVIGLTIVAAGTSLPEVATSLVAAVRGQRDIAVGNVIGSNIFNIAGVLGISAAVSSTGLAVPAAAVSVDTPVMLAIAVATLPVLLAGQRLSRAHGLLFLAAYAAYTAWLVLDASRHPSLHAFQSALLFAGLPVMGAAALWPWIRSLLQDQRPLPAPAEAA